MGNDVTSFPTADYPNTEKAAPTSGDTSFPVANYDEKPAVSPTHYSDMSWGDYLPVMAKNAIPSAGRAISGIGSAIMHPVNTAEALWDIPKGIGSKIGRYVHEETGLTAPWATKRTPEQIAEDERVVDAIGGDYANRYGSKEGFWKGLAEDPFAYGMDIASVVPAVGAAGKVAGVPEVVSRGLAAASKASEFADPVQLAMKAAKGPFEVVKSVNSLASGVPKAAFDMAQETGRYGDAVDRAAFKAGKASKNLDDLPDKAMSALNAMKARESAAYGAAKGNLLNVTLDRQPIIDAINSVRSSLGGPHNGPLVHKKMWDTLDHMEQTVNSINDTTPVGLDNLKRGFNAIISGPDVPYGYSGDFSKITNAIKGTVTAADPTYAGMLERWGGWKGELNDIQKTLAAGEKSAATTRLNKLLRSIGKEDRMRLIDKLEETPEGKGLKAYIAGASLQSITPGRLATLADFLGGALTSIMFGLPMKQALAVALTPIGLGSPRFYGNISHGVGRAQRVVDAVGPGLGAVSNAASQIGSLPPAPYKSGGRVASQAGSEAERLIRSAEKARKALGMSTEPLLQTPDHAVASALEIANRSI